MSGKMAVDVEKTLDSLGVIGYTYGDELLSHCPMHKERTGREDNNPSWSINLRSGLFNCFSCGYSGNVYRLISDLKGVPYEEAQSLTVRPSLSDTERPKPYVVVKDRSLPESFLARFELPPEWAMEARGLTPESCAVYGVLWNPDNDSWITPIRDPHTSKLLGWQEKGEGRRYFNNYPGAFLKKSSTLYGINAYTGGRMIVVESPLDTVRLHSIGVQGGVSSMGVRISSTQLALLSAADSVIFALDNDVEGRLASEELLQTTRRKLRSVFFFNYGESTAKDIGEMSPEEIMYGIENRYSRMEGVVA